MTARRPSRVIARTPLRIPVTIWRKNASGTTLRVGSSSDTEKRGVWGLVKSGKRTQQGKPYARRQHSELQLNQLFWHRPVIRSQPSDYGSVILYRFRWLAAGGLTIRGAR